MTHELQPQQVRTYNYERLVYFGHPVNSYGNDVEAAALHRIAKYFRKNWGENSHTDWAIINPNGTEHQKGYQSHKRYQQSLECPSQNGGMGYFRALIEANPFEAGVFIPFYIDREWALGAGVIKEIKWLLEKNSEVFIMDSKGELVELPGDWENPEHILNIEQTRELINEPFALPNP